MRGRAASDGVSMPWPPPPTSAGPSLVSILLDAPMLMPPALFFLILETRNDYVRFHAYQSALLTTPLLVLLLLFNLLIPLPAFLRALLVIAAVGGTLYAAFRAWKDAQEGLERYWLPYIGPIADRWVSEE
ncbi:hypothetical protein C370_03621 [Cryptococcus neoformans A1-35-8]|nr:hypothetical protein C353_03631 [Cryptococcus neoformans var. grubii AD1-83a]OXG57933.1 hypothetical protein C354_03568 [Cryptococcus neoformans var. grubii MW-RSA1955]OXG62606.1 hypothetical protein C352_03579 [Cryptococcus neoformans var. grubii CHC193]OXH09773.1 hypothetical protein C369_03606 [Cryptococcus neoformans var. grubii A5-35-17]OXH11070.1 hypothetical protein C370_03621 [Cryptococcus neoformans var. grubii A1-35-8]